ncbi:helix-turn-helix transcriptional regulator [uncultured Clostridium sp.]|uniref:helix-turn-helix transcriptional regulator n=1 Tax=uncultured Clostridium sp. TaxID=59620 RepID=UPI0028EA6613|nr:helix-turn-helix transcriptional regulator [uncultured Clostridium sp.]
MNKIKLIRKSLNMTIRKLAKESKVAVGYLSTLENDEDGKTNPTRDVMIRISGALDSTVPEVFF